MSAFFIVLLGGKGTTSVFSEVVGVSASALVGTVAAGSEQVADLIGVSGTAALGSVAAFTTTEILVAGVSGNAGVGTAIALAESDFLVSGVSGTAALGSVALSGTSVTSATGVSASGAVGQIGFQQDLSTSVVGVSATGGVAGVTVQEGASVSLIGVSASGQVAGVTANVTAFVSVNVTGVSATGSVGAVAARTSDDFIVLANTTSPFLHAYEWDNTTGFGAKFSDPASIPAAVSSISLLNDAGTRYLAVADSNSTTTAPFFIYTINGISGWGSRTTYNPTDSSPRAGVEVLWVSNSSGNFLVAGATSKVVENTLYVRKFSSGAFTGTTAKRDVTTPRSLGYVRVTSTASAVLYGLSSSPFIRASTLIDATPDFSGTEVQPSTLPPAAVVSIAGYTESTSVNPRGVAFAAHSSSPFVSAYQITDSIWGTKYANPASPIAGNARGVAFRSTGSPVGTGELAVSVTSSPYVNAYQWTTGGGFGVKYNNPSTLPTGSGQPVQFNQAGNCVAVGHSTSPFVSVYPWTRNVDVGFGAKFSNPSTALSSAVTEIAFSN
jgi:hypothetical protein